MPYFGPYIGAMVPTWRLGKDDVAKSLTSAFPSSRKAKATQYTVVRGDNPATQQASRSLAAAGGRKTVDHRRQARPVDDVDRLQAWLAEFGKLAASRDNRLPVGVIGKRATVSHRAVKRSGLPPLKSSKASRWRSLWTSVRRACPVQRLS